MQLGICYAENCYFCVNCVWKLITVLKFFTIYFTWRVSVSDLVEKKNKFTLLRVTLKGSTNSGTWRIIPSGHGCNRPLGTAVSCRWLVVWNLSVGRFLFMQFDGQYFKFYVLLKFTKKYITLTKTTGEFFTKIIKPKNY